MFEDYADLFSSNIPLKVSKVSEIGFLKTLKKENVPPGNLFIYK